MQTTTWFQRPGNLLGSKIHGQSYKREVGMCAGNVGRVGCCKQNSWVVLRFNYILCSSGLKTSWSNLVWTESRVKALIKEFNSIPILNLDITHFLFISKRMSIRGRWKEFAVKKMFLGVTLIFFKELWV